MKFYKREGCYVKHNTLFLLHLQAFYLNFELVLKIANLCVKLNLIYKKERL